DGTDRSGGPAADPLPRPLSLAGRLTTGPLGAVRPPLGAGNDRHPPPRRSSSYVPGKVRPHEGGESPVTTEVTASSSTERYRAVQQSEEFQRLRHKLRSFIFPM